MGLIKKILFAIFGVIAVFLVVGLFLPSSFDVQRKVEINASTEQVYAKVADLRAWKTWGVWFERDPNMQVSYSGDVASVGMKSSWISEQEGSGEMTITKLGANKMVQYSLYFPDFDMGSTGELTLVQTDSGTEVTWRDYGDVGANPVNRYFAVMMDAMIGPDFEAGLANLKKVVEN